MSLAPSMSQESNIKSTADAVKGIVEAVPVYQDTLQPAAKEVGNALQTVAKTLHIVLAPVSALVWGYDKLKEFVSTQVAERLKDVPQARLASPPPNIAGPALEALKYTGYDKDLRELYANLLATAIDTQTLRHAHPSFVQVIQQLSPDEAKMLRSLAPIVSAPKINIRKEQKENSVGNWYTLHFSLLPFEAGCLAPDLGPTYLVNLARLGLVELMEVYELKRGDHDFYGPIVSRPEAQLVIQEISKDLNHKAVIQKGAVMLTPFGRQFCYACIQEGIHTAA